MSNLLQEIEAQIAGVKTATAKQNVGVVREIGDGVAKIEGLTDAMLNEMLDFGHGITGLALNLEETEVGAIILGDYTKIEEGGEVRTTGKLLQVPAGKAMLGRVVNALGVPIAAGILYPLFGTAGLLSPIIAAAAMSFSSVSVITNALRLRRVEL